MSDLYELVRLDPVPNIDVMSTAMTDLDGGKIGFAFDRWEAAVKRHKVTGDVIPLTRGNAFMFSVMETRDGRPVGAWRTGMFRRSAAAREAEINRWFLARCDHYARQFREPMPTKLPGAFVREAEPVTLTPAELRALRLVGERTLAPGDRAPAINLDALRTAVWKLRDHKGSLVISEEI